MRWFAILLFLWTHFDHAAFAQADAGDCLLRYASLYHVPAEFVAAIIDVESDWNPRAISNKGAVGLMQLMPATARRFGALQPFEIDQNIAAGTRYLAFLISEFHGDLRLVAAAYYAGDFWIGRRQLHYRNSDVTAYVLSVRRHYMQRKYAAALPSRRQHP
ncbi:Transglycosylase SLT domain-containing protein [Granulicella rosea]|uniref:Transglycosylase SLT domain-containing protein n=1 Tax=Granulicella rosea TaxID=474952 RepID=A0A239E614_9BACT|nr:lytic transglycosylase domain-containing protein [Granulicella rosea]SNS40180.1 Transglycosylase SLT domain-containing protein [Granulicella rosea]